MGSCRPYLVDINHVDINSTLDHLGRARLPSKRGSAAGRTRQSVAASQDTGGQG